MYLTFNGQLLLPIGLNVLNRLVSISKIIVEFGADCMGIVWAMDQCPGLEESSEKSVGAR
jgi:hypothetical protein